MNNYRWIGGSTQSAFAHAPAEGVHNDVLAAVYSWLYLFHDGINCLNPSANGMLSATRSITMSVTTMCGMLSGDFMDEQSNQTDKHFVIQEAMSVVVYVDDFQKAADFYSNVLGLNPYGEIGEKSCFFNLGGNANGLYLEGGYVRQAADETAARLSFMLSVDSALGLFEKLQSESVRFVHEKPKQMGTNAYWFQFYDPSGNILEAVGGV